MAVQATELRVTLAPLKGGKPLVARRFLSGNRMSPSWRGWYTYDEDSPKLVDRMVPPGRYRVEMRAPGIKPLVRELDLRAGKITLLKGQLEAAK